MNVLKYFIILAIVLVVTSFSYSQSPKISFDRVTGLSQSTAGYIIQDRKGFIWIATFGGLNRYDGYGFKYFQHDDNDSSSLSHDGLVRLFEDNEGYIWVVNNGSTAGIDRFDPVTEKFTNFRNNPDDSTSISSSVVYHIMQDKSGDLWICTSNALNRVVKKKVGAEIKIEFERFYIPEGQVDFRMTYEDQNGNLLVIAPVLHYLDRSTKKFVNTGLELDIIAPISLTQDNLGGLLIGTFQNGIDYITYNQATSRYERKPHKLSDFFKVDRVYLKTDDNNNIWIGSNAKGLFKYNQNTEELEHFVNDKSDPHSISENAVTSLFIDQSGVLFVGMLSTGICKTDLFRKKFVKFTPDPDNPNSLSSDLTSSISGINPDELWVGLQKDGGVNRFLFEDDKVSKVKHYHFNPNDENSIGGDFVFSLLQSKNGDVWLGSAGGSVSRIIPNKNAFGVGDIIERYTFNGWTFVIYEDQDSVLWGGTWGDGLWRYNPESRDFLKILNDPMDSSSLIDNIVWAINEDKDGNLWIGGNEKGISVLLEKDKKKEDPSFINISSVPGEKNSLSDNTINVFHQDKNGTMWIGTNKGLNQVINLADLKNEDLKFKSFTVQDGLPQNSVQGILEDENGNLWLSTSNGISKFDLSDSVFINYFESDGLQSNEFWHNSYFKNEDGKMFFGGLNGLVGFYPEDIQPNKFVPQIGLTGLYIWNNEVQVGREYNDDIILTKSINATEEIVLSHKNNVFTVEFSSLHFAQPDKNKYAYYLENFEDDWNYTEDRRSANYTNLQPGEYIFRVKGSNNNGIWNEEGKKLVIRILPPIWGTWWFRVIVLFVLTGGIVLFFYQRTKNLRHQKIILEKKVKTRTEQLNKLIQELQGKQDEVESTNEELSATLEDLFQQKNQVEKVNDELKQTKEELEAINNQLDIRVQERTSKLVKANHELDRFVYSASHDLSAPLKSILGLINILTLEKKNTDLLNHLEYMEKSVFKLENVIKSMAQYSRNSGHEIRRRKFFFEELLNEVLEELSNPVKNNQIRLIKDYPSDQILNSDFLRLKIIMSNLVSNALKYRDKEKPDSFLQIAITPIKDEVSIRVNDNGIGIEDELKDKIFDMFYRATTLSSGSGLGLYIVKETVERLDGRISVKSETGQFTEFTINIPNSPSDKME